MGILNKIGFYSNMPITIGDEIVIFPCYMCTRENSIDASMIGNDSLMTPICLPIYCEYDGYSRGKNYVRDFNTERIETIVGMDILSFIDMLSDGIIMDVCENDNIRSFMRDNNLDDGILLYAIERKDVYDTMVSISNTSFYDNNCPNEGERIGDFWLSEIGFEKYDYVDYDLYYRPIGYIGDYYVTANGYTSPKIFKNGMEINTEFHNLKEFIAVWEKLSGFKLTVSDRLKSLNIMDVSFDVSSKNEDENYNDIYKFPLCLEGFEYITSMPFYKDVNIFTEYYRQRFCDFAKFNKTLRKVCGYYRPSSYAYQTIADRNSIGIFKTLNKCYSNILDIFDKDNNISQ